jgi:hypothetical protein
VAGPRPDRGAGRKELRKALDRVKKRIPELKKQADKLVKKVTEDGNCGRCATEVETAMMKLKDMLDKIASGIDDPEKLLEIQYDDLSPSGGYPEEGIAAIETSSIPGFDPVLNLNEYGVTAWDKQDEDTQASTMLHELSHLEGDTSDFFDKGPLGNAHTIDDLMTSDLEQLPLIIQAIKTCKKRPNAGAGLK